MENPSNWEATIPNRLAPLMRAIEDLDHRLEQWGADTDARYLSQLAVEELGTNIIKYGYDDQNEHVIRLNASSDGQVVRICLEDDGHEFNPCRASEPDPDLALEDRKPGGWGISLVRRMLAGMDYERRGDRNIVCVAVQLHSASAD